MKLPKGLGNMGSLIQQAQAAMEKAKALQNELKVETVEAETNGVKVKFNGVGEVLSVSIPRELVDPNDIETLEDAILLALREGFNKSIELRESRTREITGGLSLPGL